MERFGKVCKLVAFKPFASAADALEQINAVSESTVTDDLKTFLETNLPKVQPPPTRTVQKFLSGSSGTHRPAGPHTEEALRAACAASPSPLPTRVQVKDTKKAKFKLGVSEPKLGSAIQETTGVPCIANEMVRCHDASAPCQASRRACGKASAGLTTCAVRACVRRACAGGRGDPRHPRALCAVRGRAAGPRAQGRAAGPGALVLARQGAARAPTRRRPPPAHARTAHAVPLTPHVHAQTQVKFNVNKVDNMIIQAIALLDTLDKDINTFVMRVREW